MGWMSAPQPDPGIGEAARASAELGKETFDFYKSIYQTDLKPMQERQLALAERATQSYLEDSQLAREEARRRIEEDKANKDLRDKVKADAMGYDSRENIERRQGIAAASANQQFSNARDQSLRSLSRYGVNPNSSAFARTNERLTRDQALATAGMQTGAAFDTMDKAIALRAGVNEAASGRSNTAGQYIGLAGNSLGGAVGAGSGAMADARANAGMVGQGAGYGLQGYNQSGNLYGQEFQGRMAGYNAQMGAIAGLAGAAGTYYGLSNRPPGKADGGEIHSGPGHVKGPGGPVDDKVPAMLSNGEYVIPADVVKAKGVEFFDKLKAKYHTPAAQQRMGLRRN
jgi:hypothetical protein